MHIRLANLKKLIPGNHRICIFGLPIEESISQEISDMYIRVANFKKLNPGNLGYAHSDCQSKKTYARKCRICIFGLPVLKN